ncbi:MAG: 6-bladed beta-propeller [Planctomycetes bacterium]|nr:6-bladed beta-propeller [Planctomycetota bacterium]
MEKRGSLLEGFGELLFGKKPLGVLVAPYAVAVDATGILFVADSGGAVVHAFDRRTHDYRQFSTLGKETRLQRPVALAVLGDRVYVADSALHQVCVFRRNGEFLLAFGQDRLERPAGIAIRTVPSWSEHLRSLEGVVRGRTTYEETPRDATIRAGAIYVADTARHTIAVFDHKGAFLRELGTRGLGPGQFNFPTHLSIDRAGRLYVSDTLNYRIQVFGPDDQFLHMFGRQGDRPGNFAHPCGVASDGLGNIYVTDRQFENVQIFDSQGNILMALGQEGSAPGEFWLPAGVCVDTRNRVYVADSFNKRVQIFELLVEK